MKHNPMLSKAYNFHKDCVNYESCTEMPVRQGKHEYIRFECPVAGQGLYYKNDLHKIKWPCSCFRPKNQQLSIFETCGMEDEDDI